MATCTICWQEMTIADDCATIRRPDVLPYSREPDFIDHDGWPERCHDCNVVRGSVHHPHCIEAWCVTCDKKRFFCGCDDGVAIIG